MQTNHGGISQKEGNTFPHGQYSNPVWETSGICNAQNGYFADQFNMHMHNIGYVDNAGQHGTRNAYSNDVRMQQHYYSHAITAMSAENSGAMIISQNCIGQGDWGDGPANYFGELQNEGNEGNRYMGTNTLDHTYAKNQTFNESHLANGMTEIHPIGIITETSSNSEQGHFSGDVWYPSKEQRGSSHTAQHPQPARRELKQLTFHQPSKEAPLDLAAQTNRATRQEADDRTKKIHRHLSAPPRSWHR